MNFLNKLSILALVFVNFAAFGMEGGAAQEVDVAVELTLDQQLFNAVQEADELEALKPIIKDLLDKGANINAEGKALMTPLITAISKSNPELVGFLLENGAEITPLAKDYSAANEDIKKLIEMAEAQRAAKPVAAAAETRKPWWRPWQ